MNTYFLVPVPDVSFPISTFFLFLVLRPPPRSTLFPYTTLFRSQRARGVRWAFFGALLGGVLGVVEYPAEQGRSEEHTSELQSLRHLVCRLLLEKKKNIARLQITPERRNT